MEPQNKSHSTAIIITLVLVVLLATAAFLYLFIFKQNTNTSNTTPSDNSGFSPFGRPSSNPQANNSGKNTDQGEQQTPSEVVIPALRLLSATPIGGYGATTTASTSIVHWIDRGRGNILEARGDSLIISTLSNTLLPRVYESIWNKDASGLVASILGDDDSTISTVFASLIPHMDSSSSTTPYDLRGRALPAGITAYAASPKKDEIFFFVVKNDQGIGYVAPLNGGTAAQLFTTPLTQINVEWPEDNTIAITTKGSANEGGFMYFVNPKTGVWKKIVGPLPGLSTRVSHDARYVLISASGSNNDVLTGIYAVASSTGTDAVIRTLADKCVWGNFYKSIVYCAVPFQPVSGTYPDDWYKGDLSTIDKIWQINATTGEVHLVSSVFDEAKRSIDAFNLGLDSKDDFLYFMNKNDLSFWSLDLVASSAK
jgi:hypothetical protein